MFSSRINVLLVTIAIVGTVLGYSNAPPAVVRVSQSADPLGVRYEYSVTNNSSNSVVALVIGRDVEHDSADELNTLPAGWSDVSTAEGPAIRPTGWNFQLMQTESSPYFSVEWRKRQGIPPGQTLAGFAVLVSKVDSRYKCSHFNVKFNDGSQVSGLLSDCTQLIGDINGDGKIDCADVAALKALLGMKAGYADFDPFADLNHDGIIDVRDLAILSQKLPSGTRCQ